MIRFNWLQWIVSSVLFTLIGAVGCWLFMQNALLDQKIEAHKENVQLRQEAVEREHAEWYIATDGLIQFRWRTNQVQWFLFDLNEGSKTPLPTPPKSDKIL